MMQETFHLVKLLKRFNPEWSDKSFKEIENALLWYALHNGVIYVHGTHGESLLLARPIRDIRQGLQSDVVDPDGKILWVEFFYKSCNYCSTQLINIAFFRWSKTQTHLGFHRIKQGEEACSLYTPKFLLKYLEYGKWKHSPNTQSARLSESGSLSAVSGI